MDRIEFKYDIGDIVTLAKMPSYSNWTTLYRNNNFKPKEYKIGGLKYIVKEDGSTEVLYRLYAYLDEYIRYDNWIDPSCIEGNGSPHTEEISFISMDGEELKVGDEVYVSVYYGRDKNNYYVSPNFTFTRQIKITDLFYRVMDDGIVRYQLLGKEVYPNPNGEGSYWAKQEHSVPLALKNATQQFIADYVMAAKESRLNPSNDTLYEYEQRKDWLTRLGVYEEVCKAYNKRSPKRKGANEAKSKVQDIASKLNEEEKKELLKLLSKENGDE